MFGGANASAQEIMTTEQITALAERVKNYTPRDQFDTPPAQPSVAGKRFSYTVTPLQVGPNNMICDGFPTWGYVASDGKLDVGMTGGFALSYQMDGKTGRLFPSAVASVEKNAELTFHSLTCRKVREPNYTATNGFGAKFEIHKETDVVTAIAEFGSQTDSHWHTYWETQVSGDAARQLTQNVRVRISGTLSDWWPGTAMLCGKSSMPPTIDLPLDSTLDICMMRGHADRVEVLNAATGEVLYSATRR